MRKKKQFKNALMIIKQIRNDEWDFRGNYEYDFKSKFTCYRAVKGNNYLWCANGAFFCGIEDKPWELGKFGFLVWFFAARKRAKKLERIMRRQPTDLTS